MSSLDNILQEKINKLQNDNIFRAPKITHRLRGAKVVRDGKKLISFSCNDYLGLSQDRRMIKAGIAATKKYGVGAGASRLVTGNNELYETLEAKLAEVCGAESAAVYSSGYMANIGAISALAGVGDLILADKLSHSCIIEGSQLSNAEFRRFEHNDIESVESLLMKHRSKYKNCLVITESVFSMDGDSPDLVKLQEICRKYDAWLMVDHAHDLNHLTVNSELRAENLIKMGTLSKAVGTYGGYIAGSKTLIDYLKSVSRSFIYTTGLPPAVLESAITSLTIINEEKWRVQKALENAAYFREMLLKNLDKGKVGDSVSQIVPVIVGKAEDALALSDHLREYGFLVHAIRPPTVPVNTSRLRFSFSSHHDKKQIDKVIKLLIKYFQ